jgi:plastocyanin
VQRAVLLALLPIVVVGGLFIGRALRPNGGDGGIGLTNTGDAATFEYDYVIPPGTAARMAAGETVGIVPRALTVQVGESIRIVNDDDEGHVVGVFYVGAGETLTKRFTAPGELSGSCSVHSDGEFTLRVEA